MTLKFKRQILTEENTAQTCDLLQGNLVDLIDLALLLKQAHWCVVGSNFRSVHVHLDEIIEVVRAASDEVAERITTLGVAPDGRAKVVAKETRLQDYSEGLLNVPDTVALVANAMKSTIEGLRASIDDLGNLDPISEDLCVGVSAGLEKHLWMVQAQEV